MKKFTNNQRLKMIDLHFKDGWDIKEIAKKFNADYSHIKELISLYSYHGFDAIKLKSKYVCYTKEEKEKILNEQEYGNMTNCEIASKYNISPRLIRKWKNQIKHKISGGSFSNSKVYSKINFMKNKCKNDDGVITLSKDDFNAIKKEIERLKMENEFLKKVRTLSPSKTEKERKQKIVAAVQEIRLKNNYNLNELLTISNIKRSTFFYTLKSINNDKDMNLKTTIKQIFVENKGYYGYRRITSELKNQDMIVNHKKVKRLMYQMNLYGKTKKARRYNSYKGDVGRIAPNILNRNFKAKLPNTVWATDVTEFKVGEKKLYLSPIKDLCSCDIVSYNLSTSPNFSQITNMLNEAFSKGESLNGLIFHSDQGWQYQMRQYQNTLKEKGIIQSMSRKGNCLDNSKMETFFSRLKNEIYYGIKYKNINELKNAIKEYIYYYNNRRIQIGLGGLTPSEYRLKFKTT